MIGRIVLALLLCATPIWAETCAEDKVRLEWNGGAVEFKVEIADTPEARNQGLMFVETMPRFEGMLFVYPKPQRQIAF